MAGPLPLSPCPLVCAGSPADFGGLGGLWRTLADFGGLWRTLADFGGLWRTRRTLADSADSADSADRAMAPGANGQGRNPLRLFAASGSRLTVGKGKRTGSATFSLGRPSEPTPEP